VLLARLQRMETDEASALDEAMFGLHTRFASVMDQLKLVLDRLPPGPARRGEIAVYLQTLIDWLNTDPWPRDPQFGGSALTLAAIERRLRITDTGRDRGQDLDADGLAQQCMRLVILGGPGSGKTWLAKRTARRCAEDALEILAAGGTINGVELPLYTTASRLFGAGGDIREAVVSSALGQIGDLGGSRISTALRVFFAERNAPTLLIIDSLDEAHGPSDRLRQAGTLPWRIVLTSRQGSWRNQLAINDEDQSHCIGELQPLRYPGDVEPFIERWFAGRPKWGSDLAAQIVRRPSLQQAATVPLLLAFYCIISGTGQLPDLRRDLYTKVLNRMLTGHWRGDGNRQSDPSTSLPKLRAWAWEGAAENHPVSGVGTWTDDIPTERVRLGEADSEALDHIATPLGSPDVDTGKTVRRFIHRSIRDHLVAEHVANLPEDQAVEVLLPHLWYDPDWEYVAPAALAMHPQHDQLLRDLICRAATSDQIPADLSAIDAMWEFRRLLARVAAESTEADWSPEIAGMICQARVELAKSGRVRDLGGAAHWGPSDRQARAALLELLAPEANYSRAGELWRIGELTSGLVQLAATPEDKRKTRDGLLTLLSGKTDSWKAWKLAGGLVQLDPTAEDKGHARAALLALLARETFSYAAERLTDSLVQLDPTAEDKRQVRDALLALLACETNGQAAEHLAGGLVQLDPTAEDKGHARAALLALLARETSSHAAERLAGGLAQLDPTAEDKRQARAALLALLARETFNPAARWLADGLVQLDPTAEDKRQARAALLALLGSGGAAEELAHGLAEFTTTAEDSRQARAVLLALLARETNGGVTAGLARGLIRLDPTAEDKRQARAVLLALLASESTIGAGELAGGLAQLDPTAEDSRQARAALLALLARETNGQAAKWLTDGLVRLDPTAEDKRQAHAALLMLLASETNGGVTARLTDSLVRLDLTTEDKRQARAALLTLLVRETSSWAFQELMDGLVQLDPTAEDKGQARAALLTLLARETSSGIAEGLARQLTKLDPTAHDIRTWLAWAVQPTADLLATVRRNSALIDWLEAFPSLATLSSSST